MSAVEIRNARGNTTVSLVSLFASSATLICCALPALFVTLGAGASLVSFLGVFPFLIVLSQHKIFVSIVALVLILIAGYANYITSKMPCPIDKNLAQACNRMRKLSKFTYYSSGLIFISATFFTYVLPGFI